MADAATPSTEDASRGKPYYEKLRSDLKASLEKKRTLDRELAALETQIADKENGYLEDTISAGNIIKGFENYIKASSSTTAATSTSGTSTRKRGGVTDADRVFSRSSVAWRNKDMPDPAVSATPSESATPAGRDTPVSVGTGKAGNKKKKVQTTDKEDTEDSERPTKRGKVSWARE